MDLTALLSLRDRVPDGTLLDALELAQLLPERPCRVRRADLEGHWLLTQPALHRRLRRLQQAGLLDYETEHGTIWINRVGPM
jgi:DNA-binding IclR family transcriptional regulator